MLLYHLCFAFASLEVAMNTEMDLSVGNLLSVCSDTKYHLLSKYLWGNCCHAGLIKGDKLMWSLQHRQVQAPLGQQLDRSASLWVIGLHCQHLPHHGEITYSQECFPTRLPPSSMN